MSDPVVKDQKGRYVFRAGTRGLYWIWWVAGALAQIVICLPWAAKHLHLRALALTTALFVLAMAVLENTAIHFGWWVWNEQKLLGPKVLLVPLEEFLLYFVAAPSVLTIMVMIFRWLQIRAQGKT